MATEKRLIDAKGKYVLNAGDLSGHIMCFENGYATVFDRFAKVICKFSILEAPAVDAAEVVHASWRDGFCTNCHCQAEIASIGFGCTVNSVRVNYKNTKFCPNCGAKMDGGVEHGEID